MTVSTRLRIQLQRHCIVAACCLMMGGVAARADVLRGFEMTVDAASDSYGIFHSLTTQVNALATPYTYSYASANAATGTSTGLTLPAQFIPSFPAINVIPGQGTRSGAVVSPDPFYVRTGAYVKTPDADPSESGRAAASVYFGDVIRVNGPAQPAVPVQFKAEWELSIAVQFPSSFAASALGIYDSLGEYPQLDVGILRYFFLLGLQNGIPLPGGGCDPGEESPCVIESGGPASLFSTSYQKEFRLDGQIVEHPFEDLIWQASSVTNESQQSGDGTYQFQGDPFLLGALFSNVRIIWTHTALLPVDQDLYLSGGWGGMADCDAPDCYLNYYSLNSAALSIQLPEGYSLWSEQGYRYLGLLGEPEEPVAGEVPEPGTALFTVAGLFAVAAFGRRRLFGSNPPRS